MLLLGLLLLACLASLRTYVLPLSAPPPRADLVLVVGPVFTDSRWTLAQDYVRTHPGAVLLVSVDDPQHDCRGLTAPGARELVCFRPEPFTTRGEARAAGAAARARGLTSVLVVAPPDQLVRAELRLQRCLDGPVHGLSSPRPLREVAGLFAYQNAAMLQAYVQPTC